MIGACGPYNLGGSTIAGAKTNAIKIINGYECVKFERKERVGTDQPT